jgi:hypothetical protein
MKIKKMITWKNNEYQDDFLMLRTEPKLIFMHMFLVCFFFSIFFQIFFVTYMSCDVLTEIIGISQII